MNLCGDDILREIEARFKAKPNDFPRGGHLDYPKALAGWISKLEADVLPKVTAGANARDGSGHLTMHDKEHITRVVCVAADLIKQSKTIDLSSFELVILVITIYLHDIGNIFGRSEHEKKIGAALKLIGPPNGMDNVEYRTALQIASAHGGYIAGSKDTISKLEEQQYVMSQIVRPRLIAALLRLADELADDPARANRVQLDAKLLPKNSELYHVIATGLHSQIPNAKTREICLSYNYSDPELFKREFEKNNEKTYLLDEIFHRSLKAFQEARYCSRFIRPYLEFERVTVEVLIFDDDGNRLHTIKYTITEQGYGSECLDIYEMVPELASYNGNGKLTASYLEKLLDTAQEVCND